MANKALTLALLVSVAILSPSVGAQQSPPPAAPAVETAAPAAAPTINVGVPTMGDLDKIQGELILAQARLQLVQAQQSLSKAQGAPTASGASASTLTPVVAGVFGTESQPYARFLLGDGGEAIGRPGDVLPGEFRVVHVGVDKVVIKDRKGREIIARFSSTAPAAPATDAAPGATGLNGTTSARATGG